MKYRYFFTITAGRTGSAWLSDFLGENLAIKSIHEPLAIEDMGVRMPDIRLMRSFNTSGNSAEVRTFFKNKFDEIQETPAYAETNHTLAKCGLVENLAEHPIASQSCIIILRRNFIEQCVSYLNRGDFRNVTISWQWYLDHRYPNNMIHYAPFEPHGPVGLALWYVYEMDARQLYYERLYSDKLGMISTTLEDLSNEAGAARFLTQIGHEGAVILPERRNMSRVNTDSGLVSFVQRLVKGFNYDGDAIVQRYLDQGRQLTL